MGESETIEYQIFDDVETGDPDPRQQQFHEVMGTMTQEGYVGIGMRGFRASSVDLGWISEQIFDFVIGNPEVDDHQLTSLLRAQLPTVVQRLKGLGISTEDWPDSITIDLETRDDHGTYEYRFTVPVD